MNAYLSVITAIIGLVMYLAFENPKLVRIGEILLFCGVLVSLLIFGGHQVSPLR